VIGQIAGKSAGALAVTGIWHKGGMTSAEAGAAAEQKNCLK